MSATNPWITYRTRFLVKAKQLNTSLVFTDILGRQHSGQKGDYLVESNEGVLSIAPRQIFEDIYVPLPPSEEPLSEPGERASASSRAATPGFDHLAFNTPAKTKAHPLVVPPQFGRKSPQPYRDRRNSSPGLRSL